MPGGLPAPNGNGVDRETLKKQGAEAEKKGVPTHTLAPDATPQEKAAQVRKGRDQLASVAPQPQRDREIKIGDSTTTPAIPTIVIEDHGDDAKPTVIAKDTKQVAQEVQEEAALLPGALPTKAAHAIPDWYRVGWRQVSGIDKPPLPEGEERDKGVLDMFVYEQFYGTWYHNAGIIIFAVLASHFLTRFNFGWGWLFIVLAVCNTYYSTSMERVRRYARDDIQRELVKVRLASEHESADWINNFLDHFWPIYEPVLSATILASVDQILSTNTPAFLDSLRMPDFTLGNKSPRIDRVRTFPKTEDDVVMMDWGLSFTPKDTSDMTEKQKKDKVNPRIELSVRLGKGLATAALPILVEDVSLSGLLRIRLKLMANFPHVQVVDMCFLEKPVIDYVLKPIGGETFGFDIANIPGLSSFIRDMTHATLGPMMYDPNVFSLNLEQMLSGKPLDAAIGGGTPDPFVSLSISGRGELAKTKYKSNTYNPTWMETKYLLVHSLKDILEMIVYDFNDHRKNTLMSSASFPFEKLLEDPTQEGVVSPLLKDGKQRGELRFDINYFPVIEPEEGKEEVLQSTVGIVRVTIHQAKELDHTKSLSGDLNPFARVYLNSSKTSSFSTRCFKHTNNPIWEAPYEFLCTDKNTATIGLKVIDDRDFLKDPVIGYMSMKLADLLDAKAEAGRDWFPLSGCKTGKMRLSAEWKPLSMAGALHGSDQYKPPIGVVKLLIDRAVDVKNVEATLGGKSDPYVRVQVQNVTKGRTEVVNNNLNPVWDQIIYIPVHTLKETLLLECMDYQNLTRDRSLGSVELHVSELAVESPEDPHYPFQSKGIKTATDSIHLDKGGGVKGTLHYTAEFIPSLNARWEPFEKQVTEAQTLAKQKDRDEDGGYVSDGGSSISSDEGIPEGTMIASETSVQKHTKNAKSLDSMKSAKTVDTTNTTGTTGTAATAETHQTNGSLKSANGEKKPAPEEKGIVMTHEELLEQQSGIIVFHIMSGRVAKKARVEVLVDDAYWPCFSTVRARGKNAQWDYVGEGFMKEVDFGRVWLRLNDADEGEKDEIVAEWKGDAKAFLQATLNGPQTYTLKDDLERNVSTVVVEARYIPVPVKLEPRETVNNQGILRVELVDGREIRGVDRGGKSDPYAVFTLNGQKVFKSQIKKKTLTPEWNENFEVSVPSRVAADFSLEIFDWNQIEVAKSLGTGKIELADLEPFEAQERLIHLVSDKHGDKGQIRLRFVFQPEIIAKSRKNTSTFTSAGRAMTSLGGLPASAGKGVFHGVTGVFKRDKEPEEAAGVPPDLPTGQASQPVGVSPDMRVAAAAFPSTEALNGPSVATHEPGTLRVTVLDAKDLPHQDVKPYATIRVGDKEYKTKHTGKTNCPEWNESFTCAASVFTPKCFVWIHDHKTLGKDKEIGEGEVDIWRHIKPQGVSAADVFIELRQGGLMRLRLEFDASANPNPNPTTSSAASVHSGERRSSFASPSRFSLRGRRPNDSDE
ncbi:C2 domain-containing protein [Flammula alnicola]|nr:C2 domain-containing protein [Flammula alnicola]